MELILKNEIESYEISREELLKLISFLFVNGYSDEALEIKIELDNDKKEFFIPKEILDIYLLEKNITLKKKDRDLSEFIELNLDNGNQLLEILNLKKFYYNIDSEFREFRINEIHNISKKNLEESTLIFNQEKEMFENNLDKLTKILRESEIKIIYDKDFTTTSFHGRRNMSEYNYNGITYIYKEFDDIYLDFINDVANKFIKLFEFIQNMNDLYFNIPFEDKFNISIIKILKKILLFKEGKNFKIGYLMENIDGVDVRKYKGSNIEEYHQVIIPAIHYLIKYLTHKKFLIIDFALDNVMWIPLTKTIVMVDIDKYSFNREEEALRENPSLLHYYYYKKYLTYKSKYLKLKKNLNF